MFVTAIICYRYHEYSPQNHFAGSTIASLNQSLYFRLIWNQPWHFRPSKNFWSTSEEDLEIRRSPAQIWRTIQNNTKYGKVKFSWLLYEHRYEQLLLSISGFTTVFKATLVINPGKLLSFSTNLIHHNKPELDV